MKDKFVSRAAFEKLWESEELEADTLYEIYEPRRDGADYTYVYCDGELLHWYATEEDARKANE